MLGTIHDLMACGNKQLCRVVHAGEELEAKARAVVDSFKPAFPELAGEDELGDETSNI